jgi:hypothetical protein
LCYFNSNTVQTLAVVEFTREAIQKEMQNIQKETNTVPNTLNLQNNEEIKHKTNEALKKVEQLLKRVESEEWVVLLQRDTNTDELAQKYGFTNKCCKFHSYQLIFCQRQGKCGWKYLYFQMECCWFF